MDSRDKLLSLADTGYFNAESLLQEIVIGMSTQEAQEMFEHIARHHDINDNDLSID